MANGKWEMVRVHGQVTIPFAIYPLPFTISHWCSDPLHDEGFDDVADLDVVVLLEADAALEPGLDLDTSSLKRRSEPILPS